MKRTYRLDGMLLRGPADLPLPGVNAPALWQVGFGGASATGVCWTGDATDDGRCWARFGRAGATSVVRLEGVLVLAVDPALKRATIEPLATGPTDLYLLRRAMPYLVHLAGGTALHAACVVAGGETWLLCGEARCGKSTLALALDAAGNAVLADDHVALIREGDVIHAESSFPYADVLPDAVKALRPDLRPAEAKQSVPLVTTRPERAQVTRIAFLRRGARRAQVPVALPDVAHRLLSEVIFLGDPSSRSEQERRLDLATVLAQRVPTIELTLPEGLDRLREGVSLDV